MKVAEIIEPVMLPMPPRTTITSISIEENYDIHGSYLEGDFIISGDYRLHEISINKEDLPVEYEFNLAKK